MKELFKNRLTTIGLIIFIMFLFSYKNTNNDKLSFEPSRTMYQLPLKQRDVIVTDEHTEMKKLIKKGYVVEDVDISFSSPNNHNSVYTLILY